MSMAETLRKKLHVLEPYRSVFDMSPLEEHLSDHFAENRLRAMLLTAFAIIAMALACTGLYGTLSYMVSVRRREIGLRLALGATRSQITASFLMKGVVVSLAGCCAGLALARLFTQALAKMLFGVSTTDIATYMAVIATVISVSLAAALMPALRAANFEPMQVLREE